MVGVTCYVHVERMDGELPELTFPRIEIRRTPTREEGEDSKQIELFCGGHRYLVEVNDLFVAIKTARG